MTSRRTFPITSEGVLSTHAAARASTSEGLSSATDSAQQLLRADAESAARAFTERSLEPGRTSPKDEQSLSPEEAQHLIHELQVHQIELEMQNDELRRTHGELRESRERYFDLYDQAPVGYLTLDNSGTIIEANLTAAILLGVPRSSLVMQQSTRFVLAEDQDTYFRHRRQLFETGVSAVFELRLLRTGAAPFWARIEARLAHDTEGTPVCRAVISDVTERKQAEELRERLQGQLHQALKTEAVGRLAGGIAHDFNNLLTVISCNIPLALMDLPQDHPLAAVLSEVSGAANRAARLTKQLLAFARKQLIEPKVVNANDVIRGVLGMLERVLGADVEVRTALEPQLGATRVDPGQLEQILVNLALNARDAMPKGGRLSLATANVILNELPRRSGVAAQSGEFVMMSVTDTGQGMDDEVKAHLFEPFFTTKPRGQGTGLGLATIDGTVTQLGGAIEVDSELGKGACFRIYLPRVWEEAEAPPASVRPKSAELPQGREIILFAEDEESVRNTTARFLKRQGYCVLVAADGAEALELAASHAGNIDLLLTDVVMPRVNGRELAEELTRLRPTTKVLFSSGYSEDVIAHHGVVEKNLNFIPKPYTPQELALKIRAVLATVPESASAPDSPTSFRKS